MAKKYLDFILSDGIPGVDPRIVFRFDQAHSEIGEDGAFSWSILARRVNYDGSLEENSRTIFDMPVDKGFVLSGMDQLLDDMLACIDVSDEGTTICEDMVPTDVPSSVWEIRALPDRRFLFCVFNNETNIGYRFVIPEQTVMRFSTHLKRINSFMTTRNLI